ncbi:unnamed protein product, partial [Polarella glacialis]
SRTLRNSRKWSVPTIIPHTCLSSFTTSTGSCHAWIGLPLSFHWCGPTCRTSCLTWTGFYPTLRTSQIFPSRRRMPTWSSATSGQRCCNFTLKHRWMLRVPFLPRILNLPWVPRIIASLSTVLPRWPIRWALERKRRRREGAQLAVLKNAVFLGR